MDLSKLGLAVVPQPIPNPRVLKPGDLEREIHRELIDQGAVAKYIGKKSREPDPYEPSDSDDRIDNANDKLSSLIADDFPFDDSQLEAIEGVVQIVIDRDNSESPRSVNLTGAAGTGKTTTTKAIVDRIRRYMKGEVNLAKYWNSKDEKPVLDEDGLPVATRDDQGKDLKVPSICMATFTGKASQEIKKNFPRDWHSVIMTIHRMLGFVPEYYEDMDESGCIVNKRHFVPTYCADLPLPWDVIILDEAGMIPLDLWLQVKDALKPGTIVIFIGDINQLPPVHGKSTFGFSMAKFKTYELTHIHRQVGENNSIVDGAWNVLQGKFPTSDLQIPGFTTDADMVDSLNTMLSTDDWKFCLAKCPPQASKASHRIRQVLELMHSEEWYDPYRDITITPINGFHTSRGYTLGQLPMNRELSLRFNTNPDRYIIDGGREQKDFAVDDRVMATKNDHQQGITNGMMGIVTSIEENGGYLGDKNRYGIAALVHEHMQRLAEGHSDGPKISLEDLKTQFFEKDTGKDKDKEDRNRGPSSHIVTVKFGTGENAFEIAFGSLSEVGSLMTAYVVTCHKMQGAEAPIVFICVNDEHVSSMYREWLYTAITRASHKVVVCYSDRALSAAIRKQKIKGRTLELKIESFREFASVNEEAGSMFEW